MLTETQWQQYEHKTARTGFFVQKRGEQSFWIVDQHGRHYGEPFTDHEAAVAHFLTTTYAPLTVRVDTCVQDGAKNKPQWARKTQAKVNVMNGGSL